nr:PHD finger protein [Ipomoea batatas]GME15983.1 PHD finger protein [Ipomoea batatas]GME16006.1 PHD finger protein [Ipomoea batatas]
MVTVLEVEPPSPLRYVIGAAIMMAGVVLPLGYMMFRNKRVPSSSYSKQTIAECGSDQEQGFDIEVCKRKLRKVSKASFYALRGGSKEVGGELCCIFL